MEEKTCTGVDLGKAKLTWETEKVEYYKVPGLETSKITFKELPGCFVTITMGDTNYANRWERVNFMIEDIASMMELSKCGYHLFCFIEAMYLAPEFRGKGISRNIFEEIAEFACTDDRIIFTRSWAGTVYDKDEEVDEAAMVKDMAAVCGWLEYLNFVSTNVYNGFDYSEGFVLRSPKSKEIIRWLNEIAWKKAFRILDTKE